MILCYYMQNVGAKCRVVELKKGNNSSDLSRKTKFVGR